MTNFIPLFPLNIVVYPGEQLNLHIFEERYKQLISECFRENKVFGVVPVMKEAMQEVGTTVLVQSIEKVHPEGEMDIRTEGQRVFKILEQIQDIPDKLYSGAIVTYPENQEEGVRSKMTRLLAELRRFHSLLEVNKEYKKEDSQLSTYDLAHHAGLSLEQEYELLLLMQEGQRQEFLERHLRKTIPTIIELQQLKKRIEMNGHFRKLSVNDGNE